MGSGVTTLGRGAGSSCRRGPIVPAAVLTVCACGLLARAVTAQETASPPPPATQPSKTDLDPPYIDGSFGFSVRPPAGCTLFREKQIADGDVEVARFVDLVTRQWSFTVRLSTTTQPLDAQTMIAGITARLNERNQDVKVLRGEPARIAGRDGIRYAAAFKADEKDWLRLQAVVPVLPDGSSKEYFALVFITPLSDQAPAEALFERMVASFQILRDTNSRQRIEKALVRGQLLLARAARGDLNLTGRIFEDTYYRCLLDGKDVGYVRVSERADTVDHHEGLRIRQWGWRFDPDGTVTHLQYDMFLSSDLGFERWDNKVFVITPAAGQQPRKVVTEYENALRRDDRLLVAYQPLPGAPEMREKALAVEKSYASAAWNVAFPRLIDLAQPDLYAFSTYTSQRRGMVLRTLEVIGPAQVTLDGRQVPAVRIEDSEGLIPPRSELYVGPDGKMLRLVAGQVEMVASDLKAVERLFAAKVADGENLLKQLKPSLPRRPGAPPPSNPVPQAPITGQPGR